MLCMPFIPFPRLWQSGVCILIGNDNLKIDCTHKPSISFTLVDHVYGSQYFVLLHNVPAACQCISGCICSDNCPCCHTR